MDKTRKLGRFVIPALAVALALGASASTSNSSQAMTAKSGTKSAATPVAASRGTKTPITFSITSRMRHGNIVVLLDGVPVFNEVFTKPALLISQTTVWDPLPVAPGKHKLSAKVYGNDDKVYLSAVYDLDVSRTKGIELRFKLEGDKLTVKPIPSS